MPRRRLRTPLLAVLAAVPVLAVIPGSSMIQAILGISFLIFVHEWGHFMACRLTGTRTETFSIGFGPRLFGWEKDRQGNRRFTVGRRRLDPADHAMDFRIAAVPLGGYVKMAGEIPGEGGSPSGRPPAPDEFPAKSAWARTFIISAGVIMNFITATVFYVVAIQQEKTFRPPVVGQALPGGAAWNAGLRPGDRITEVGGHDTPTWIDLQMEIAFSDRDESAPVVVRRDGQDRRLEVRPSYDSGRGVLAFGISSGVGLEVGEGDARLTIGIDDGAQVAGVPVRGGAEANDRIVAALRFGIYPVPVRGADGREVHLAAGPAKAGEPLEAHPGRIGLGAYRPQVVKAVREAARGVLEEGDVLQAAVVDHERVRLDSREAWETLVFRDGVTALVVTRGDAEVEVPVTPPSRARCAVLVDDVALEDRFPAEKDDRVQPLPAGQMYLRGLMGVYRLDTAPALEAGVRAGDHLVRVGTTDTASWTAIEAAIRAAPAGEPLALTLRDDAGAERTVQVTPVAPAPLGRLPVTEAEVKEHWDPQGLGHAITMGAARTVRETKNVFRTIGALFSGTINFDKNIAGPITLVKASRNFAEDSFLRLLWFLAYVSVMLAVLNILPIPVLDGGHLMFILIEKIKGRPLSDATILRLQKVGFLLLLVLMVFAFKNDLQHLW